MNQPAKSQSILAQEVVLGVVAQNIELRLAFVAWPERERLAFALALCPSAQTQRERLRHNGRRSPEERKALNLARHLSAGLSDFAFYPQELVRLANTASANDGYQELAERLRMDLIGMVRSRSGEYIMEELVGI